MNFTELKTIDDVIRTLEVIILDSLENNDPLGYFAALYQKVTVKVKEGIQHNYFEDGPRMEQLDIVFAKRYIDAWVAWKINEPVTQSWEKAFTLATKKSPLVLQHLLIGMNAHINLDLGIAAVEVSPGEQIPLLENDFNKINQILASLVIEVQNNLSAIWPMLKWILSKTGKIDDLLVDFSMEKARKGAWKSATEMADLNVDGLDAYIHFRDTKVAVKSKIITNPGFFVQVLIWIIRIGEIGSVAQKIEKLKNK